MAKCKVYEAMGDYEGTRIKFAEVYEYSDGTATVYDEFWGGAPSYFGDRPEDRPAVGTWPRASWPSSTLCSRASCSAAQASPESGAGTSGPFG